MKTISILSGVGVVVALVLGITNYVNPTEIIVPTPTVNVAPASVSVPAPVVNVPKGDTIVGAVSGPDTYFPYVANNNVRVYTTKKSLASGVTGTTTPCAIRAPSATSTLRLASLQITTSTSTAGTWSFASSTTAFATTTTFGQFTVTAGSQYSYVATSTYGQPQNVFGPNQFIVFGVQGYNNGSGNGFMYGGSCQAEFVEL